MSRSLLNQFTQLRGSVNPADDLTMALADFAGRLKVGNLLVDVSGAGTITVTSGTTFTADDEGNYIVISGSAYKISAYTNSTTVTVAGSPSNGSSFDADLHYYKNVEDDFNYIRTQLKNIGSGSNWYDTPNIATTITGTPTNMFYADGSGNITSTSHMTYDDTNGIVLEHSAGNDYITIEEDALNIVVGGGTDYITIEPEAVTIESSGEMTINAAGNDMLFADGTDLYLTSDGTAKLDINPTTSTITLQLAADNKIILDDDTFAISFTGAANLLSVSPDELSYAINEGQIYVGNGYADFYAGSGGTSTGIFSDVTATDTVRLKVDNTTELELTTDGMSLKTGASVNEIAASAGILSAASTDDQLATAKLIYDTISASSATVTGTPTNMFYTNASGIITDTSDMTYDVSTGNITLGDSTDTRLAIYQNGFIYGYANNTWRFMISENQQVLGLSGTNDVQVRSSVPDILFQIATNTEMTISADGMSLKTGASVNEILASTDSIDISSTDAQLATAKLVYDTISAGSATVTGTPTNMFYADAGGTITDTSNIKHDPAAPNFNVVFGAPGTWDGEIFIPNTVGFLHEDLILSLKSNTDNWASSTLGRTPAFNGSDTWVGVFQQDTTDKTTDVAQFVSGDMLLEATNTNFSFWTSYDGFSGSNSRLAIDADNQILGNTLVNSIDLSQSNNTITMYAAANNLLELDGDNTTFGGQALNLNGVFTLNSGIGVAMAGVFSIIPANGYGYAVTTLGDIGDTSGDEIFLSVYRADTSIPNGHYSDELISVNHEMFVQQAADFYRIYTGHTGGVSPTGTTKKFEIGINQQTMGVSSGADGGWVSVSQSVDVAEMWVGPSGTDGIYITDDGIALNSGGDLHLNISDNGIRLLNSTVEVNEILNVTDGDSIDASSTDNQLATAKLVYDTISTASGTTHSHYELDLDFQGSNVWNKTDTTVSGLDINNMDVYLNGLLNRDHEDYFTATVSGAILTVTFAYETYVTDWAHVKFFKYDTT